MRRRARATLPDGRVVELYSIGELAFRVGRSTETVRKWEIAGVIPATCFRDKEGCRMYTLEMINLIVDTATECQVARGRRITSHNFPEKLAKKWEPLLLDYLREPESES